MGEIKGKIVAIGNEQRVSDKFTKREFVIETDDKFPKKICFQLTNDKVDLIDPYQLNETVQVHYNIESKEHNGKWFTNVTAWRIEKQHYNQDQH
jgi:single-strand DNA-binding protein